MSHHLLHHAEPLLGGCIVTLVVLGVRHELANAIGVVASLRFLCEPVREVEAIVASEELGAEQMMHAELLNICNRTKKFRKFANLSSGALMTSVS